MMSWAASGSAREVMVIVEPQLALTTVDRVRLLLVCIAAAIAVLAVLYIRHTSPRRRNRRNIVSVRRSGRTKPRTRNPDLSPSDVAAPASADYGLVMADEDFIEMMLQRFRERAAAVKRRNLPPVGGEQRAAFVRQARLDYRDFSLIGEADARIEDGILTLRIDLRPGGDETPPVAETRPPVAETRPPVGETRPPVGETRPSAEETRPPVDEP